MSKFWGVYVVTTILSGILLGALIWFISPYLTQKNAIFATSPLPWFLTRTANAQVTTLDVWMPSSVVVTTPIPALDISGKNALSYDLTTNKILYEKNTQEKVPLASLTKIMTAIVALEHPKIPDEYIVTNSALVGEDSMGLSSGEVLTLQDLLYGLVLHSGNDAAEVLADNFPGGRTAFIAAMNQKAKSLGLTNSNFTNPTGLEGDGDQYTTAYDLLVITHYALENFPIFREVVSTFDYTIPATTTHKVYYLENETNLLTSYPGVQGVKTGYTPEAGLCLVTYLTYKGHDIIAVLLGSDDRRGDMKEILDYSLKKLQITPPPHG